MAVRKKIGYGSFALVFLVTGFLIQWKFGNELIISHSLFNVLGLDIYSNGTDGFHYPFLTSIPFWLLALLVSKRNSNDFGTLVSERVSELMLALSVIVIIGVLLIPFE
ncbi:MAG TPA: hypothetical protein IAA29_01850 [Candidatus Paenibacillus intestinavium]|nr:hypothetical protein [Candidatus Paenibacillus intestinavium]